MTECLYVYCVLKFHSLNGTLIRMLVLSTYVYQQKDFTFFCFCLAFLAAFFSSLHFNDGFPSIKSNKSSRSLGSLGFLGSPLAGGAVAATNKKQSKLTNIVKKIRYVKQGQN